MWEQHWCDNECVFLSYSSSLLVQQLPIAITIPGKRVWQMGEGIGAQTSLKD